MLTKCEDGSDHCLESKNVIILISVISLLYSCVDKCLADPVVSSEVQLEVQLMRKLLHTLFQMANVISLIGALTNSAVLIDIYLWYMLGFVIMALVVTLLDFVAHLVDDGPKTLPQFISEVFLLFVVFRCLPLVDNYKRHIVLIGI